jgi:hypothetical protein
VTRFESRREILHEPDRCGVTERVTHRTPAA